MQSTGIPGEGSTFLFSLVAQPLPFAPVSPSCSVTSPRWLVFSTHIIIFGECRVANEVQF